MVGVRGHHLVDKQGHHVRLLGVNRSGTEYACQQGYGFFDGPSDKASIRAMESWHINAVRVPLNETCWLGINGIQPKYGGGGYRKAIRGWVSRLEHAGLYVILDLHWAAPGSRQATGIIPMSDADHAPAFWRSVAAEYKHDRAVLFDLYNEPHGVGWGCWEHGCEIHDKRVGDYRAAGMTELLDAVRSTGARQPVMLGGIEWARDDDGWLAYLPPDPPTPRSPPTTLTTSPPATTAAAPPSPGSPGPTPSSPASWGRATAATTTSTPTCAGPTATASPTSAGPGTSTAAGPAAPARP